ncbi:hypothetical protein LCGC14_1771970 [marine sediment metagenome]|uniref:Uncharacterized protein n=1 Tax=marine sediment metagenome TaxID=412755 RepID=A0A0F9GY01_9ZZZZ|nr:hypothetical protein [Pricia sp.]
MAGRYILMGDIVGSSTYKASKLRREFKQIVSSCNKTFEREILSPYTITLGDEFQGVTRSLRGLFDAVFYLEEISLLKRLKFKMRYAGLHGEIDTPINRMKAHGMMGAGLTRAREMLTAKRRGKPRFQFELPNAQMTKELNLLFLAIDGIIAKWDPDDGPLILDMIANNNNVAVGKKHKKNRTQIWKRRKNMLIEEFRALKEVVLDLAK